MRNRTYLYRIPLSFPMAIFGMCIAAYHGDIDVLMLFAVIALMDTPEFRREK